MFVWVPSERHHQGAPQTSERNNQVHLFIEHLLVSFLNVEMLQTVFQTRVCAAMCRTRLTSRSVETLTRHPIVLSKREKCLLCSTWGSRFVWHQVTNCVESPEVRESESNYRIHIHCFTFGINPIQDGRLIKFDWFWAARWCGSSWASSQARSFGTIN